MAKVESDRVVCFTKFQQKITCFTHLKTIRVGLADKRCRMIRIENISKTEIVRRMCIFIKTGICIF